MKVLTLPLVFSAFASSLYPLFLSGNRSKIMNTLWKNPCISLNFHHAQMVQWPFESLCHWPQEWPSLLSLCIWIVSILVPTLGSAWGLVGFSVLFSDFPCSVIQGPNYVDQYKKSYRGNLEKTHLLNGEKPRCGKEIRTFSNSWTISACLFILVTPDRIPAGADAQAGELVVLYKRSCGPAETAPAHGAGTQVAQTHFTAGWLCGLWAGAGRWC